MLSMPPATINSASPLRISRSARVIEYMPLAQTLLTVKLPTSTGRPALIAAWRLGIWPTPAGTTRPMITSFTAAGSMLLRSISVLIQCAPRSGA
jgi:hypothetical protein